jgi:hypothetical protein
MGRGYTQRQIGTLESYGQQLE